jgi:hypothetical protein
MPLTLCASRGNSCENGGEKCRPTAASCVNAIHRLCGRKTWPGISWPEDPQLLSTAAWSRTVDSSCTDASAHGYSLLEHVDPGGGKLRSGPPGHHPGTRRILARPGHDRDRPHASSARYDRTSSVLSIQSVRSAHATTVGSLTFQTCSSRTCLLGRESRTSQQPCLRSNLDGYGCSTKWGGQIWTTRLVRIDGLWTVRIRLR